MKTMSLLAAVLALGLTLGVGDADAAKRLGGGKSTGMQREMSVGKTPGATPAQAPTAPAQAAAPAASPMAAAPAAAAQPKRSWMGPLAGIAAGLGLAALASHFGFGEELASFMMIALLAMVAFAVIGMILRRRAAAQRPALATASAGGMAYQAEPAAPAQRGYDVAMPPAAAPSAAGSGMGAGLAGGSAIGAGLASAEPTAPAIPADFDLESFVRSAKVNFIRLQAANDARNLEDIREYTTPELFAEIKMNWMEQSGSAQKTDVVSLNAEVLDVTEEAARYIVSVRFTGLLREDVNAAPEAIDETWHLTKPQSGNSGWLVAGIQQNA